MRRAEILITDRKLCPMTSRLRILIHFVFMKEYKRPCGVFVRSQNECLFRDDFGSSLNNIFAKWLVVMNSSSDRPIGRLAIYSKYPATIIKFVLNDRYGYRLATISCRRTNGTGPVHAVREPINSWSRVTVFTSFPLSDSRIAYTEVRRECVVFSWRSWGNCVARISVQVSSLR